MKVIHFVKTVIFSGSILIFSNINAQQKHQWINQNKINISNTGFNSIIINNKTIIQFPYKIDSCLSNNENFKINNISEKNGFFTSVLISLDNLKETAEDTAIITCRNDKNIWKTLSFIKGDNAISKLNIYYLIDKDANLTLDKITPKTVSYHYMPTDDDFDKLGIKAVSVEDLNKELSPKNR